MKSTPITKELVEKVKELQSRGINNSKIAYFLAVPISVVVRAQEGEITQIINCVKCGKQLYRISPSQKYCSEECRDAVRKEKKTVRPKRYCHICGNELGHKKKYFCSPECGQKNKALVRANGESTSFSNLC